MTATQEAITALTDAVAGVAVRVDEDVAHLLDLLDQANGLLAQAQANDAADAAAIAALTEQAAALTADAEATVASITAATDSLKAIDPLADFPAPVEPPA